MTLGIYIGGTPNRQIDCKNIIDDGNPGIGGTEYEFAMLASYLGYVNNSEEIKLTVFQSGKYVLHHEITTVNDVSQNNLLSVVKESGIEILIVDSRLPLSLIKSFNGTGIKLIVWCHCVGSLYRHLLFSRWEAVRRVVFVSRGHYLNYIDNPIVKKSSFVFNAISVNGKIHSLREKNHFINRPHDVVFMGALDESKGFHVLARVWPEVLKVVPDAKLHVIGSANLYGGNFKLGSLGIADEIYEKKFYKYITTSDGKLHPSIVLHGQLGEEKYDVMTKCRVGIPNPDGRTETFCICAVEMELCGCKTVTKWSSGYMDTVPPPNVLVENVTDLSSAIAQALLDDDFNCNENVVNINKNFSICSVGLKWISIIKAVDNNEEIQEIVSVPQKFKLRNINSALRKYIPFIPPIGFIRDTFERLLGVLKRSIK